MRERFDGQLGDNTEDDRCGGPGFDLRGRCFLNYIPLSPLISACSSLFISSLSRHVLIPW